MSQVLLESVNPHGTLRAVVEDDGRTVYFYLWNGGQSEPDALLAWVQNLGAPAEDNVPSQIADDRAPENPAEFCREPSGVPSPEPSSLEVVWLPEGNGAALSVDGAIQAIIPPTPTGHRVPSYSVHASVDGPLARVLRPDDPWMKRLADAAEYWKLWQNADFWEASRKLLAAQYEDVWGRPEGFFSIDNDQWPPRGLLKSRCEDWTIYSTMGLSLLPQPNVPAPPEEYRRMELAALLPASWSEKRSDPLVQQLAQMAWFPWVKNAWLGPGHAFDLDSWGVEGWSHAFLMKQPAPLRLPELGPVLGDPVNLLLLLPATRAELDRAKDESTATVIADIAEARWAALAASD